MAQPRTTFVAAGQRFGRGVVIDPEIRIQHHRQRPRGAVLRCDCGGEYRAALSSLLAGTQKSCGCLRAETQRQTLALMVASRLAARAAEAQRRLESGEKQCRLCGVVKPLARFPSRPSAGDGRTARCCDCMARLAREARDQANWQACARCSKPAPHADFISGTGQPVANCAACRAYEKQRRQRHWDDPAWRRRCYRCKATRPAAEFRDDGGRMRNLCAACQAYAPPENPSPELAARLAVLDDPEARRRAREAAVYRPAARIPDSALPCCDGAPVIMPDGSVTGYAHDRGCVFGKVRATA